MEPLNGKNAYGRIINPISDERNENEVVHMPVLPAGYTDSALPPIFDIRCGHSQMKEQRTHFFHFSVSKGLCDFPGHIF